MRHQSRHQYIDYPPRAHGKHSSEYLRSVDKKTGKTEFFLFSKHRPADKGTLQIHSNSGWDCKSGGFVGWQGGARAFEVEKLFRAGQNCPNLWTRL